MNFLKTRKSRKELKEILHYAKHVRHMHEDVADPAEIENLKQLEKLAKKARGEGDVAKMEAAGSCLIKAGEKTAPPRKDAKIRENVEVLFVAVAAAMAIRAYFFQPFKIPTGSMQPTLYGITVKAEPAISGNNPVARIANFVLFGERHTVIRAKTSGYLRMGHYGQYGTRLDLQTNKSRTYAIVFINDVPHKIPMNLWIEQSSQFRERYEGRYIQKGDVLFDGVLKSGDYILVNRIKYNFVRPKRGDIAVFDTRKLTHPQVRKDSYYIKRMVGLPGETISLNPPYLLVNGKKPADPRFNKIFSHSNYNGYVYGDASISALIAGPGNSISLADDQYLFFGDNTLNSLDGRYFGPVNQQQIMGPAFFVCWPLDRAGFAELDH
ncbi:MAG: signal peptidase I [Kiritimatiellales bacterium]